MWPVGSPCGSWLCSTSPGSAVSRNWRWATLDVNSCYRLGDTGQVTQPLCVMMETGKKPWHANHRELSVVPRTQRQLKESPTSLGRLMDPALPSVLQVVGISASALGDEVGQPRTRLEFSNHFPPPPSPPAKKAVHGPIF